MIIRRLRITAVAVAARNPAVRREAGKLAQKGFEKARPTLLKGARRAGEMSREFKQGLAALRNPDDKS